MSKALKVLVIQTWLNYRGAEMQSLQLVQDLRKLGREARLVCLFTTDAVRGSFDADEVIVPANFIQRLLKNPFGFWLCGFWVMLYLVLRYGKDYDIYNAHNFPSVWCAVIASVLYRKPVVWTVHNFPQHPFVGIISWIYESILGPVDRWMVRKVARIESVSQKVADQVFAKYRRKSGVIYPGIAIEQFQKVEYPSNDYSFLENKKVMLHVGRLIASKGQQVSVDIFESLAEKYPDLILVFIGEGNHSFLKITRRFVDRIYFIGVQPRELMGFWYSQCDIIVSPYFLTEGCTAVPLEAMVLGCFPIVARLSGVDEILEKEQVGLVIDCNRWQDFLSAIESAVAHSRADYSPILAKYSRKVFAENYLVVFDSLFVSDDKKSV